MTTFFSWTMYKGDARVRFVLADHVLIRMECTWGTEWMVRSSCSYPNYENARDKAVADTRVFEEGGFFLYDSVCRVATDIKPTDLNAESVRSALPGPSLRDLFSLTWTNLQ